MSGRKDYSYTLAAASQAIAAAEELARRAARAAETRERLNKAKDNAHARNARLKAERREKTRARLAAATAKSLEAVKRSEAESKDTSGTNDAVKRAQQAVESAANIGIAESVLLNFSQKLTGDEVDEKKTTDAIRDLEAVCREQSALNDQVGEQTALLMQWQESLAQSEEVQNFARGRMTEWIEEMLSLTEDLKGETPHQEFLIRVQAAIVEAESIEATAGEISDKFHARNKVMTDIIDSLKEIGFFVQNPEFADADRPEGTVIIRANRGDQIMTAEVNLDQKVQSDWQGIHGEYCTDAFFDYVKAMSNRGITITPENPNLKPRLLQKGAMELPKDDQQSRGGN